MGKMNHVRMLVWGLIMAGGRPGLAYLNVTLLDCEMRRLSLRYAQFLQPWLDSGDLIFRQVYEALQLKDLCHVPFEERRRSDHPDDTPSSSSKENDQRSTREILCPVDQRCIFVDPNDEYDQQEETDGSVERPVKTLEEALEISRASRRGSDSPNTTIFLRQGIHFIQGTVVLGPLDQGLSLKGFPGEEAWISGGVLLPNSTAWQRDCRYNLHVRVANLTDLLLPYNKTRWNNQSSGTFLLPSLFGQDQRFVRARYPDGNPETAQWGYRSPDRLKYSIDADQVLLWHRPPPGPLPNFEFVDLRTHNPAKNDSDMEEYNMYASGSGGVCAQLWGPSVNSYWCSNASAGGWAEVDLESAVTGQLQFPVGLMYNGSSAVGQRLNHWQDGAVGGIIHAWHSQTWAMHMFSILSHNASAFEFRFAPGGGKQGARNWCRCDQCSYAAPWCGQHQDPPIPDNRLIGGRWMVENVLSALDQPGEYYFDPVQLLLYVYPNASSTNPSGLDHLRLSLFDRLIEIRNTSDITVSNLGFRDVASTYMDEWLVPSGGDWSLHRGAALFLEDVENIIVQDCKFRRLDSNAIMLSKQTRFVSILRNTFEWLGESAIILWGETRGHDATLREHPMFTTIEGNVMRELGIYQKQSSAVASFKAALTTISQNIMFNMPRAAINFNDMMGGGDSVQQNLIFNTCRESGDHGPINTWDRQPFLSDLRTGKPSFEPIRRTISSNMIMANYGAAEGVDNDDGSSWYHITSNVFYDSEGFKMDYGGHDSLFEDNLVIGYPAKNKKCLDFASFSRGNGHVVRRNRCILPSNDEPILQLDDCDARHFTLTQNQYFTPSGTAQVLCRDWDDGINNGIQPFGDFVRRTRLELGSSVQETPKQALQIVQWAMDLLSPDLTMHTRSHIKFAMTTIPTKDVLKN